MKATHWTRWTVALSMAVALNACSTWGWRAKDASSDRPKAQQTAPETVVSGPMTMEMAESDLRSLAAKDIAAAAREDRNAVHRLRPYYFKRYSEYPSPEEIEVDIAEKDSQTSPYLAEVVIPKVRYATRLHRNRDDAAADQNYFRNTGLETISYEFRNGRWLRLGSLFHAIKVEENVNGEWLPLREEVKQTLSESQQEQGWFSRSWYAITGR